MSNISRRQLLTQVTLVGGGLSLQNMVIPNAVAADMNNKFNNKPLSDHDKKYLLRAIALSEKGDYPYGALLRFEDGEIIEAWNTVISSGDPTRHAEMTLFSKIFTQDLDWIKDRGKLKTATLYTSAEPCTMCAGGIFWVGIGRVVHGASVTAVDDIYKEIYPDTAFSQLPVSVMAALHEVGVDVNGPYLNDKSSEVVRRRVKSAFDDNNPFKK